jgi:hypothetical protein
MGENNKEGNKAFVQNKRVKISNATYTSPNLGKAFMC